MSLLSAFIYASRFHFPGLKERFNCFLFPLLQGLLHLNVYVLYTVCICTVYCLYMYTVYMLALHIYTHIHASTNSCTHTHTHTHRSFDSYMECLDQMINIF